MLSKSLFFKDREEVMQSLKTLEAQDLHLEKQKIKLFADIKKKNKLSTLFRTTQASPSPR